MEPVNVSPSSLEKEPIAITEAIRSFILAFIPFTAAFGIWKPSDQQVYGILGLLVPASILLSFLARKRSTPNSSVALTNNDANLLSAVGVTSTLNQPPN